MTDGRTDRRMNDKQIAAHRDTQLTFFAEQLSGIFRESKKAKHAIFFSWTVLSRQKPRFKWWRYIPTLVPFTYKIPGRKALAEQ